MAGGSGPPNPYLSQPLMPTGPNSFHALRQFDNMAAIGVAGHGQGNSKKPHNRALSNDDRVMEVEGFVDASPGAHQHQSAANYQK